jgi:hypothetical protein
MLMYPLYQIAGYTGIKQGIFRISQYVNKDFFSHYIVFLYLYNLIQRNKIVLGLLLETVSSFLTVPSLARSDCFSRSNVHWNSLAMTGLPRGKGGLGAGFARPQASPFLYPEPRHCESSPKNLGTMWG